MVVMVGVASERDIIRKWVLNLAIGALNKGQFLKVGKSKNIQPIVKTFTVSTTFSLSHLIHFALSCLFVFLGCSHCDEYLALERREEEGRST